MSKIIIKTTLENRRDSLKKLLESIEESLKTIENGWYPEVVIRKRDGELGIPKYTLDNDEKIKIEVSFPAITGVYNAQSIKIDMDAFVNDFVEYTPKVRGWYPKT